jgi:hypothetical protein
MSASDDNEREQVPRWLREEMLEEAGHECTVCARSADASAVPLHLHHKVPLSQGGSTTKENLVVLCRYCHRHYHSQVKPEDLDTDLEGINPSGADVKIIDALERFGEMRQCDVARTADVYPDHARERLKSLMSDDVVARPTENTWDLAERVEDPYRMEFFDDVEESTRYSRDSLFRELEESGLSRKQVGELANLSRAGVRKAINRADSQKVVAPAVDNASDRLFPELVRQVVLLQERIENLEERVE